MRILLVDDDPEILSLVTQFLALSTHHDVMPAASAQEALEAISKAREPFGCLLTDIQMPTVDGIALVQMVRETPGYRNTPIIMLTATQDKAHLDRAFSSGASDYVAKPFDFTELQKRLQEAQKLSVAKTRASLAVPGLGDFADMGGDLKGAALRDAIVLPEVEPCLDYTEFENYVRQLLQSKLPPMATMAVKIDRVDRVYAAASTKDFQALLSDAAAAIGGVLLSGGGVMSYRGNGIFLCLPDTPSKAPRKSLQKKLNQRLAAGLVPTGRTAPKLVVGDPVPLANRSAAEALDSLSAAIENVETHAFDGTDMYEVHGRLMKQQRFNDEQRRLEKRAFESLLRESMTPSTDETWTRKLFRRIRPEAGG